MITTESSDKELLDYPIPGSGQTVRSIGGISFLGWVANQLNGVKAYKAATQELLMAINNPPIGRMAEPEKVTLMRKLLSLDIKL